MLFQIYQPFSDSCLAWQEHFRVRQRLRRCPFADRSHGHSWKCVWQCSWRDHAQIRIGQAQILFCKLVTIVTQKFMRKSVALMPLSYNPGRLHMQASIGRCHGPLVQFNDMAKVHKASIAT